jgi:hypothetical protein
LIATLGNYLIVDTPRWSTSAPTGPAFPPIGWIC